VSDGPVDADLRERFFASAEAVLAVLAEVETPSGDASAQGTEPGCKEHSQRVRELEALLDAGNTRALDSLPWLERCFGAEASDAGGQLLRQIETLDFPAALETLRGLAWSEAAARSGKA